MEKELSRLEAKAESIGLTSHKEYLKKRLSFIRWARDERYTLQEIGEVLGTSKNGIYKILKDNKFDIKVESVSK